MSRKSSSPPGFETLADKLAAKLVREHATEGHTSCTSYISDIPVLQASMKAKGKRPAVPSHVTSQKKRRLHEDVGLPDAVRLVSRSSDAPSKRNSRVQQVGIVQRTPRSSARRSAAASFQLLPAEILAAVFDLAINSEFHHLLGELTQRNADAYQRPVMPSVLSAVCKQWSSILVSKPSMWRRISFSLSENDDLCDIPGDFFSSLKRTWQYHYVERAKKLPLDVIIHRWSSTESNYITNLFDSLFRVPPHSGTQPGQSPRTINFIRSIVITSADGGTTSRAHLEPWPLRYCAPDVSLVSFGRQDWAALKPLLCSAQTLELYQSATLPYQGCLAQTKHLFMEFADDPCEEILPSHAVHYIIENSPSLQSLAVGYTRTGSLLPRGYGDEFVHPCLDHLQISPNDLCAALSPFEHGLSAPNVSRVTLLELPPSNAELTAKWSRFATNIDASTVMRLDMDIIAIRGVDDSWRALLAPFVGVRHLVVHPTASMAAVLRALLPVAPYDWSRRLLPRLSHIEMTSPNADAFVAVKDVVHDRLQLAKTGAGWISAITQVDIYDYDSGAFSSLEWIELSRLLAEARVYSI